MVDVFSTAVAVSFGVYVGWWMRRVLGELRLIRRRLGPTATVERRMTDDWRNEGNNDA